MSFFSFEDGSSSNEFEFSASLRSAQDRRPLDVLGLLTYMKAEFSSANEFEFYVSLRSAQNRGPPDLVRPCRKPKVFSYYTSSIHFRLMKESSDKAYALSELSLWT